MTGQMFWEKHLGKCLDDKVEEKGTEQGQAYRVRFLWKETCTYGCKIWENKVLGGQCTRHNFQNVPLLTPILQMRTDEDIATQSSSTSPIITQLVRFRTRG